MAPGTVAPRIGGLTLSAWRKIGLAALLGGAILLPFLVSDYRTFQFTLVLIWAIGILGLNLVTGFSGQISLGHGAFYAIGAYTAAILTDQWQVPYYLTPPVAGVVCLVVGFLFGYPAGRLAGHYLALATFALAVAVPQILKYDPLEPWTGGVQGIFVVRPDPPFGLPINTDQWLYFFSLAIAVILFVAAWNLLRGRSGRAIRAIRDQQIAAKAMGVDTTLYKSLIFGVSALYTGIAGSLSAIVIQFVAPDSFTFLDSIRFFIGMVVGGLGSIAGALYGGIFIVFIPNVAEEISKAAPGVIYGVILIGFMYLLPLGVAGFVRTGLARLMRRLIGPAAGRDKASELERKQVVGGPAS
ncbi:MAG: branched-chain amino acid ABC transporter permease [Alphaproteobacteria bacterium]|jgi:branched-chain amino acid transport system permease protein|nr:branched-chain amino acid ABC transporter permease [Alphaproteobacteria bacterium]MDP6517216.1 branched-chain amino acid ABC transporter permease [Alphaproteobacteria bacterium]